MKILAFALSLILASSGFAQEAQSLVEKLEASQKIDFSHFDKVDQIEMRAHLEQLANLQQKGEILQARANETLGYKVKIKLPYVIVGSGVTIGLLLHADMVRKSGPDRLISTFIAVSVGYGLLTLVPAISETYGYTYAKALSDMTNEELLNEEASLQKRAEEVIIKVQTLLARYNMGSNE